MQHFSNNDAPALKTVGNIEIIVLAKYVIILPAIVITGYTGVSTKIEQSTFPKPFKFLRGCTITQNSDDWVMILGKTTTLNGISQLRLGYFAAYTNKAFYMDYIAIGTY